MQTLQEKLQEGEMKLKFIKLLEEASENAIKLGIGEITADDFKENYALIIKKLNILL